MILISTSRLKFFSDDENDEFLPLTPYPSDAHFFCHGMFFCFFLLKSCRGLERTNMKLVTGRATMTQTGTANPVWNEKVTIPQVEHLDAKLVVTVCNKRAMGRCTYTSTGSIYTRERHTESCIPNSNPNPTNFPVKNGSCDRGSDVYEMVCTYY